MTIMNKIFKYFMMVVVAVAGISMTSCSSDDDNYSAGEASDGAFLYSDFSEKTYFPSDTQAFSINVGRTNSESDATYQLICTNDKFVAPTSVSFKAGETTVSVPVSFDIDLGSTETVGFKLADNATVYGVDSISLSITRDYTWEVIGTADFTDAIFTDYKAKVYVSKAKELDNLYKFVAPMTYAYKQNGEDAEPGESDLKFTMDEEGNITPASEGLWEVENGTTVIYNGSYSLYFNSSRYGQYCYVDNNSGKITWSWLLYNKSKGSLDGPYTWSFDWNVGYPYATSDGEGTEE